MNKRPPFLGYNHNVRHKGRLFHVQTEDSGLSRPVLTTHVFVEGTILGTMRGQYTVDEADPVVQKRMQDQHKTMLKRVRDGQFDEAAAALPEAAAKPEVKPEAQTAAKPEPAPAKVEATAVKAEPAKGAKRVEAVPEHIPHEVAPETQRLAVARKPPPPPPPPVRKEGKDAQSSSGSWSVAASIDKTPLSGESTAELQPVQKAGEPSTLAARLKIGASQAGVVPPPIAGKGPGQSSAAYAALQDEDIEPVVEMEVGSSDDDEPQLTIEAAEPTEEEAQAEELSKATPLPAAMPLGHDETFMMGADQLVPPPRVGPFTVSVPFGQDVRPLRVTRPLAVRPLHSGALRARPTSEGVIVLCMAPTLAKVRARRPPRNSADPLRTTQPHLRATTPSPQSSAVSAMSTFQPSEGSQPIDDKIMSFLRHEAAR